MTKRYKHYTAKPAAENNRKQKDESNDIDTSCNKIKQNIENAV